MNPQTLDAQLEATARLIASRVVTTYTIPESLRGEAGHVKVGMRQLTSDEELKASKAGQFHVTKAQYEATKLSICELNGKPVSIPTAEVERFWEGADPKLRSLLLQAYNKLSSPSQKEEDDFFASEETRAG